MKNMAILSAEIIERRIFVIRGQKVMLSPHLAEREVLCYIGVKGEQSMTKLLEKAVSAVSNLPEKEQDAIAAMILEELADEERWAKSFATSQRQLSLLAKEALEEYRSGRTIRLTSAT